LQVQAHAADSRPTGSATTNGEFGSDYANASDVHGGEDVSGVHGDCGDVRAVHVDFQPEAVVRSETSLNDDSLSREFFLLETCRKLVFSKWFICHLRISQVLARVARRYIFKPIKLDKFWKSLAMEEAAIFYIWTFDICIVRPFDIFYGNLVYISPFSYVPRTIWPPWF
jgi:hypothetical protein